MPIDAAEVRRIAALARLRLDERTVETFRHQLETILDYVAMLDRLDVGDVPPTATVLDQRRPLRPDEQGAPLEPARATAGAPDARDGLFRVPRVIKG